MRLLLWLCLVCLPLSAEVVLEVSHSGTERGAAHRLLEQLIEHWKGAQLRFRVAPPKGDLDTLKALEAGDLQVALVRSSALANYHRRWGLTSLAYQWPDPQAFLRGPQGQQLLHLRLDELTCLGAFPLGPRLLASSQPLSSWSQLRQKTVLTAQNRFLWETFQVVGAQPLCLAIESIPQRLPELSEAVLDLTLDDYLQFGFRRDFPYLWNPDYAQEWLVVVANSRALTRLNSGQLQQLRLPQQKLNYLSSKPLPEARRDGDPFRKFRVRALRLCGEAR